MQSEEINHFQGHNEWITCVAVFPSGDKVVTGSDDRCAIVWDPISCEELARFESGHEKEITSVAVFRSEDKVITGSRDKKAIVWRLKDKRMDLVLEGHASEVWAVDVFPKGDFVITGSIDRRVVVWNARTGKEIHVLEAHDNWITSVVVFPDWSGPADRTSGKGTDGRLAVWDDRPRIITGSSDGKAAIWNCSTWDLLSVLDHEGAQVYSVAVFPTKRRVITGCLDKKAIIWNVPHEQGHHSSHGSEHVKLVGHAGPIYSVAVFPNEEWVVTGSFDRKAIIWDATEGPNAGKKLHILGGHTKLVLFVAPFLSNDRLITASGDKKAIVWQIHDNNKRRSIDNDDAEDELLGSFANADASSSMPASRAAAPEDFAPVKSEEVTERPTDRGSRRIGGQNKPLSRIASNASRS